MGALQHSMSLMVEGLNHLNVSLQSATSLPPPPPAPPMVREVPMPPVLTAQLSHLRQRAAYASSQSSVLSVPKAVGPVSSLLEDAGAPGASGSASLLVYKHVFYVSTPGQFVDGPMVGVPVPNVNPNCIRMQHEVNRNVRSVSPSPQDQVQASGWPGALAPKGWVIAATGKCHRIYE